MNLRTLYLQGILSVNGRHALSGRMLFDRFRDLSEESLLGCAVRSGDWVSKIEDPSAKADTISEQLYRDLRPNVVYMEKGLFGFDSEDWRFPEHLAREFCAEGGVLIVADVDHNECISNKQSYVDAGNFLGACIRYEGDSDEPIYGLDQTRFWRGQRQILCRPDQMEIDDWVRPIYVDIPEILVGIPVKLSTWGGSILASCNRDTTGTLAWDSWVDQHDACPFASVSQCGAGYVVTIAGSVSGDTWAEGCGHNARWLTNIATFLCEQAEIERIRRASHLRSSDLLFLSHRSMDKEMVSEVAKSIKRLGVGVWIDEDRLVASKSLVFEIDRALSRMTHFVLFWSANCVNAPWVERELASAVALLISKQIPLIIVRLDLTPVPSIVGDLLRLECLGQRPHEIAALVANTVKRLARL